MRCALAWTVAVWAGLLLSPAAGRAQPLDRPGAAFTGTVSSADPFKLVLRADNGKLVTFPVEDPWTIPAGLVPGTRVTVRYEVAGEGYKLVGVKIASGPIEPGSTTEPPAMGPAPPSAPTGLRKQPGTSPVLPEPELEQPAPERTPEPTPEPTRQPQATPSPFQADHRVELVRPAAAAAPAPARPAPLAAPPGPREFAILVTLLLVASGLLWVAFARR